MTLWLVIENDIFIQFHFLIFPYHPYKSSTGIFVIHKSTYHFKHSSIFQSNEASKWFFECFQKFVCQTDFKTVKIVNEYIVVNSSFHLVVSTF